MFYPNIFLHYFYKKENPHKMWAFITKQP